MQDHIGSRPCAAARGGPRPRLPEKLVRARALVLGFSLASLGCSAHPPAQPASGPGGSAYAHARVARSTWGSGRESYWLFEPDAPRPESAPVVVFLHGWGAMKPEPYLAWIEHLVRRGNIVVYPVYQASLRERPAAMTPAAMASLRDALAHLDGKEHVRAETTHLALVGHSLGATIAANIAAAQPEGLPRPAALMVVEPGDSGDLQLARRSVQSLRADTSTIPAGTLMLVVVGDEDRMVGMDTARKIFQGATQVAAADKDFVVMRSDRHGKPELVADHSAPLATHTLLLRRRGVIDALDTHGLWKLYDALLDAAFRGQNRDMALGGGEGMTSMGQWSDGQPVLALTVTDAP